MRFLFFFFICFSVFGQNDFIEYTIDSSKQNFSPRESIFPFSIKEGYVNFQMIFDSSVYWTLDDWEGDRDYFDYNKGVGFTAAFSRNNRNSCFIGWRPNYAIPYTFEVVVYTNNNDKSWQISDVIIFSSGELIEVDLYLGPKNISYALIGVEKTVAGLHQWNRPWYKKYRWSGTWIGGKDSNPPTFGGRATKFMLIYGKKCKK